MKITKAQLKQIIKEELEKVLGEASPGIGGAGTPGMELDRCAQPRKLAADFKYRMGEIEDEVSVGQEPPQYHALASKLGDLYRKHPDCFKK